MFVIDRETKEITLPKGDTLAFRVKLNGPEIPENTVGVLGICSVDRRGEPKETVFAKEFPVRENGVTVFLSNQDTRELAAGTYDWDLRLVTDPEYNEDGSVRCDDASDNVLSIFSGSVGMPAFIVKGVAVHV